MGADARLTADADLARRADGVVLPGVGAFGRCVEALRDAGLEDVAVDSIAGDVPFLGICVGMQLLYEESEEDPDVTGLGVLAGDVRRLPDKVKRPQMQWNELVRSRPAELWSGVPEPAVGVLRPLVRGGRARSGAGHRHLRLRRRGGRRGRVGPRQWATQFHPEKSGATGLAVLSAFVDAVPAVTLLILYPAIDLRGGRWSGSARATSTGRPPTATTRWPRRRRSPRPARRGSTSSTSTRPAPASRSTGR